jgi:hypothetical protein
MRTRIASIAVAVMVCGCSSDGGSTTPDAQAGVDANGLDGASDGSVADVAATDASNDVVDAATGRDFSTDRTKFFGSSRCGTAGLLFCEDFESGAIDANTWKVVGTAPKVDGVQFARGAKALHVSITGNGPSYVRETKTFPIPNDRYWGRMFVYFHKLPTTPMTYAHWTFAAASGTGVTGEIRLSGQLQNGKNLFGVGTDSGNDPQGTGDWTNSDKDPNGKPNAVPLDSWLCIEWMHAGDTNETRFFWDATEHPSLATSKTVHGGNTNPYVMPQFTQLWVGWQEYQTSSLPFEAWIDEVAVDGQRIGCVL